MEGTIQFAGSSNFAQDPQERAPKLNVDPTIAEKTKRRLKGIQVHVTRHNKKAAIEAAFQDSESGEEEESEEEELEVATPTRRRFKPSTYRRTKIPKGIKPTMPKPTQSMFRLSYILFTIAVAILLMEGMRLYYDYKTNKTLQVAAKYIFAPQKIFHAPQLPEITDDSPYALWLDQHNTSSVPLDYRLEKSKDMTLLLQKIFRHHLKQSNTTCLCMHHLHIDRLVEPDKPFLFFQLCGLYNKEFDEMYMMANPKVMGGSKDQTVTMEEKSVSCKDKQAIQRLKYVFIEWTDPIKEMTLSKLLSDSDSTCMQMAIEEIHDKVKCSD